MASLMNRVLNFSYGLVRNTNQLLNNSLNAVIGSQPAQSKWTDGRMRKDYNRRQILVRDAPMRLRLLCVKKNDLLPSEILDIGRQRLAEMPRDGSIIRIRNRCAITSRPRGVVKRWRLSRIVWRHLADYNKLSGVQRAMW
uniref:EOG090X0MNX n=1 Tax=Alona affinis TaxID=381656 RepID=A0A9N6WT38_9CRUS|nr:EOG090X0MNX [Alona affinis]